METVNIKCIVCGEKECQMGINYIDEGDSGVCFNSTGNYGSQVYDVTGYECYCFICDECFKKNINTKIINYSKIDRGIDYIRRDL